MDAAYFLKMIEDKSFSDLKKMQYKYSKESVAEMLELLMERRYKLFPIKDFAGEPIIYLDELARISPKYAKLLLEYKSEATTATFVPRAMEDEIFSTFEIENIESSRESIRRVLAGYVPKDESEERIAGMKKGLDFVSDYRNKISEENLYSLYQMAIGAYVDAEARLPEGCKYRNDAVYVTSGRGIREGRVGQEGRVGHEVRERHEGRDARGDWEIRGVHEGLPCNLLPQYMKNFVNFINTESDIDDLAKAAIIHFYLAYLHPYFDGNGRMARLLQLWYLVQRGYAAAMFFSMSALIRDSRSRYYKAYQQVEENAKLSGYIDVTPFVSYFAENVYAHIGGSLPSQYVIDEFANAVLTGEITQKEHELWNFVLNHYGKDEFSTKELEKNFGAAAYATIRTFVQKFARLGLLECRNYANRPKYRVR